MDLRVIVVALAAVLCACGDQLSVPVYSPAVRADGQASWQRGNSLKDAGNWPEGARWYLRGANEGNAAAQYEVGAMYDTGTYFWPQDFAAARQWYLLAAAQGNAKAMANLGYLYLDGHGVPRDTARADQWFARAKSAGWR
jgi:TPR repeat protein